MKYNDKVEEKKDTKNKGNETARNKDKTLLKLVKKEEKIYHSVAIDTQN